MMEDERIVAGLAEETSVITGLAGEKIAPALPLGDNKLDSLGFMALLVAIRRRWNVDFIGGGLSENDSASLTNLARRIERELHERN